MRFIADLHLHSRFAYACSDKLSIPELTKWAMFKGISVMATGDFTHPQWLQELERDLVPIGNGLFVPQNEIIRSVKKEVPTSCHREVFFILESEICCIYSKNEKVRKVHHLLYAPNFETVKKINSQLSSIGNLASDGRPILGIDSRVLLEITRSAHDEAYLIPAHAWTPHFAIFGSISGFDSLEECFGDLHSEIFAIETGLSSDPDMNRKLSMLDSIALISGSDSHSAPRIGREASIFDTEISYSSLWNAVKQRDRSKFVGTIEFYPHEGRYHYDGHRKCEVCYHPEESKVRNNLCPVCNRQLTLGVLHRVEELADRSLPDNVEKFTNIIPLMEIIAEVEGVKNPNAKKVQSSYFHLLHSLGPELDILINIPLESILKSSGKPLLARAIEKVRNNQASINPGYDGLYGEVSVFTDSERRKIESQNNDTQLNLL